LTLLSQNRRSTGVELDALVATDLQHSKNITIKNGCKG